MYGARKCYLAKRQISSRSKLKATFQQMCRKLKGSLQIMVLPIESDILQ